MKSTGRCPKCQGQRIAHFEDVPIFYDSNNTNNTDSFVGIVQFNEESPGFFGDDAVYGKAGHLEAFLCADCGYRETYVRDIADINWNKLTGYTWMTPREEQGPYR